jgi:hypothetical protein
MWPRTSPRRALRDEYLTNTRVRLAIGQLLVRLLRQFRAELFEPAAGHGYPDLREPHLHIFGNLGGDGIRLTDVAARAQLSLATASELVSDLQELGYLERRADGTTSGPSSSPHPPAAVRRSTTPATGSPRSRNTGRRSPGRNASPAPPAPCKNCWTRSPAASTGALPQQLPPRASREAPLLHDQLTTDSRLTRSGESQHCGRTS